VSLPTGVRLHWREAGDPVRPPVVWIHGGSVEDSRFFDRVHALFPDTRGHGLSQKFERPEDLTYAKKAGDLLLWLDGLAIEAPVWGGASMGAALSLWVAAHHPDRVRAVISVSGPPFAPIAADREWWTAHRPLVEAGRFEDYFDANVLLRLGESELKRLKARPERYAAAVNPLRQHTVKSLLAVLAETYAREEWIAECARIRCPVLVIAGSEDRFLVATIPGARLHVVAGGSHFPNRSHRAEVQAAVAEFFAEIGFD